MDVFSLVARLTLDKNEYDRGLGEASDNASSFASKLKSGLATAAKVGAAALTAASGAVVTFTKSAIDNYANYEQLVGGVETLFKGSADRVQQYAADAYKTAGLSANEYMETVTSFSASLIQSLGGDTAKAAELSNQAIIDMSDNANKMGTDMASIQNAYSGFAKQNYTMLDNLKLGYGGTKQEMERLLADAEKLSGQKFDISSYADVIQAIHVVQTEMGITGTTAEEAASTISGSIGMLKGAWSNLVTGLGNENADFNKLIGDVVESAIAAADNLIPRVEQVLTGIADVVDRLGPVIIERLPTLIDKLLPPLLSAAQGLLLAVVQALPGIVQPLIEILPSVIEMLISTIAEMAPQLVELGVELIIALIDGITEAVPVLIEKGPEIVMRIAEAIIRNLPRIVESGAKLIGALIEGIGSWLQQLDQAIGELGQVVWDGIRSLIDSAVGWGRDLIQNFIDGIGQMWGNLKQKVSDVAGTVKSFLGFSEPEEGPLSNFSTYAPDMMKLFAQGIEDNAGLITDAISGAFNLSPQISAAQAQTPAGGQQVVMPRASQRPIQIIFEISGDNARRWVYNAVQAESQRVGVRLSGV